MVNLLYSLHSEATRALVQHRNLLAGDLRQYNPTTLSRSRPVVQRSTIAFAKSAKRAKYSQANSRPSRGQPLFIQVEPDGSDAWRLDAVVDALKSGSVSVIATLTGAHPGGTTILRITTLSSICSASAVQVGILPTDTYPALVCDISDRNAVEKLYAIKGLSPKKQLSILCRHLQDISTYTLGFPASNVAGQIDLFKVARQVLPGPVKLHVCPTHHLQLIMHHRHLTLPAAWKHYRRSQSSHHLCVLMPLHFSHPAFRKTYFMVTLCSTPLS